MRQLFQIFFIFCAFVTFHVVAKDRILVVTEEWPPYNYTNSQGEFVGHSTERLRNILNSLNIDYRIEVMSWTRAYEKAKNEENVLLFTIYQAENRVNDFQWICPFIKTHGVSFYSLATRNDIKVDKIDDTKSYSIGAVNYGLTHDWLMNNGFVKGKHLDIATDEDTNIRKLFGKRVDLIVQEEVPFEDRMKKLGIPLSKIKHVYTAIPGDERYGCLAFSKTTSQALIDKIANEVKKQYF